MSVNVAKKKVSFWRCRTQIALVIIHSVNFTILEGKYYSSEATEPYFYWGIVATIAGGLIWLQAMLFFRRRWYEMFLFIHIVMAAIYFVDTWIHIDDLGTLKDQLLLSLVVILLWLMKYVISPGITLLTQITRELISMNNCKSELDDST